MISYEYKRIIEHVYDVVEEEGAVTTRKSFFGIRWHLHGNATLTRKQHGYLQLLSQISTLTRHDDMVRDAQKWNEEYDFTPSSPKKFANSRPVVDPFINAV